MNRPEPFRLDAPEEASSDEVHRLEILARELQGAHGEPALSPGFLERLVPTVPVWSFRSALRRNRLLRAAAVLLVATASSVPVLAVVYLLETREAPLPEIVFEPSPLDEPVGERLAQPSDETVAPERTPVEELLSEDWILAVERDNRMRRAHLAWSERFPLDSAPPLGDRFGAVDADARVGLGLRLGVRAAADTPALEDWSGASAPALWSELERRFASADLRPASPLLQARVRELWEHEPAQRAWLADWMAILEGAPEDWPAAPHAGPAAAAVLWEAVRLDGPLCELPSSSSSPQR